MEIAVRAGAEFTGLPNDIPALRELMARRQWVAWRYLERDGNITKPPVNPHNGYGASHSDPATWGSYEQAAKWAQDHNLPGVGYVISDDDDITGCDLDDCRDGEWGGLEDWASEIIKLAETYAEVSPSGRGLRLIWRGKIEKTIKCDPMHVEVYKNKRYLTITGNHIAGTPRDIRPAPQTDAVLRQRVENYKPALPTNAVGPALTSLPFDPPKKTGAISLALGQAGGKGNFFRSANSSAMDNLSRWVPDLFGSMVSFQPGTGAWRVSSKMLGRNLQEDLSIAPNGIVDFGQHDMGDPRLGKRTPIDIVLEFGPHRTAAEAALWLCGRIGVSPETLGWENSEQKSDGENHPLTVAAVTADDTAADESEPIDVGELTGEPRPREWIVPDWIPKGVVSSLSGDGGMGKTLLAQQLLYAAGVGGKWLGIDIAPMRGLGVFCEDDEDELHRRHNAIKADLGHAVGNPFTDTWIWPRVGFDNLLVTFDKDNKPLISPFFALVMKHVLDKKIGLLVLDTIADLFGGNEIIRAQVNYFIKATCGAFIKRAKDAGFVLTVVLLSHPSQAGRNSGSGESGSTAWNNAVRARLYLTRPEDGLPEERILTRKKSNYSASGDDVKIDLLWSDGVLKPAADNKVSGMAIKSVESQIISLVEQAWDDSRPYKAKKGPRFLDAAMVDFFGDRVERGAIITALRNLKNEEKIIVGRLGDRRGYCLPSIQNRG